MSAVRTIAASLVKVTAAAAAIAVAQPALGQDYGPKLAYHPDSAPSGSQPNAVLTIPVTASVGGTCGFQTPPNADRNVGQIDTTAWTETVDFTPECTAPWRIAVSSANGGLLTAGTPEPGYRNKAPYTVWLNIVQDGNATPVTANCAVADLYHALGSSGCPFKGTASATEGLSVLRSFGLAGSYIRVAAPAYPGPDVLIAGTYTDTLTVTVSPAT